MPFHLLFPNFVFPKNTIPRLVTSPPSRRPIHYPSPPHCIRYEPVSAPFALGATPCPERAGGSHPRPAHKRIIFEEVTFPKTLYRYSVFSEDTSREEDRRPGNCLRKGVSASDLLDSMESAGMRLSKTAKHTSSVQPNFNDLIDIITFERHQVDSR